MRGREDKAEKVKVLKVVKSKMERKTGCAALGQGESCSIDL